MMKIIKYLVLTVSIIIFLIIGSLFSLAKYYNNEIKNIALEQINRQLNQPIAAEKISLNAFSQFPFISLEFTNFKIQNPISKKDTLIFSEKGYLNFDIYDLWDKNYKVRKLILNSGFLNICIDKKGNNNYTIFKESADTLTNEFNFGLDQVVIKNFNILYSNDLLKQDYNFFIATSKFKGAFSEKEYQLELFSNLTIKNFIVNNVNYIKYKYATLDTKLKVIKKPFSVEVELGKIKFEKTNFLLSGSYKSHKKDLIDLSLKGNKIEISEIFSVLPSSVSNISNNYHSNGVLNFNGHLKGELNSKKTLSFDVDFNAENSSLEDIENNLKFTNINLIGSFNNKQEHLIINQFSTYLETHLISGSLKLKDFNNPKYLLNLKGGIDLAILKKVVQNKDLDLEGFANFNLTSNISSNNNKTIIETISGSLNGDQIEIKYPKENIYLKTSDFDVHLAKDFMNFSLEKSIFNKDTFSIDANWDNWYDFVYLNSNSIEILYDAKIKNFHLDQFLDVVSSEDSSQSKYNYILEGSLKADEVTYKNFSFFDVKAKRIAIENNISINDLLMKGFEGNIKLDRLQINFNDEGQVWKVSGNLNNLDIPKTMSAFSDFNQAVLLSENIKGSVSSNFNTELILDLNEELDLRKSIIVSQNSFNNISLLKYPILREILAYFENSIVTRNIIDINYYADKIDSVYFENFSSSVNLKDGLISFPKSEIKNNILNFTFFGNYNVENSVDYHLNFNWSDIVKKNYSSSTIVEEKKTRGKQLFLKIYGSTDQLNYGFDKKEIKNERKQKIQNEKEIIKEIIKGDKVVDQEESKSEVIEVDWNEGEEIEKTELKKDKKNKKNVKKKDSSKFNKFLKKLGVEEGEKEKPEFEIDQ